MQYNVQIEVENSTLMECDCWIVSQMQLQVCYCLSPAVTCEVLPLWRYLYSSDSVIPFTSICQKQLAVKSYVVFHYNMQKRELASNNLFTINWYSSSILSSFSSKTVGFLYKTLLLGQWDDSNAFDFNWYLNDMTYFSCLSKFWNYLLCNLNIPSIAVSCFWSIPVLIPVKSHFDFDYLSKA